MNINKFVPKAITQKVGRAGLYLQKFSPEILLGIGFVGITTGVVLAIRATYLEAPRLINDLEEKVEDAKGGLTDGTVTTEAEAQARYTQDLTRAYFTSAVDFAKVYGPAALLGIGGVACILGSHGIMEKRQVALFGAMNVITEGFKSYRNRVVEEYGAEKDEEYMNGSRWETVSEKSFDESGKLTYKKTKRLVSNSRPASDPYSIIFDKTSINWKRNQDMNLLFLISQQRYANDILQLRGHLFLNEVYEALGYPHTAIGATCGWVLNKRLETRGAKELFGDDRVSFGIDTDADGNPSQELQDFASGRTEELLLRLNAQGTVHHYIWERDGLSAVGIGIEENDIMNYPYMYTYP